MGCSTAEMSLSLQVWSTGQISPDWLEAVLLRAGYDAPRVTSFSVEPVGTGQSAGCYRIQLEYVGSRADLPRSIVAKLPSEDEGARLGNAASGTYLREIKFYSLLQNLLKISTPRCYLAESNVDASRFALLLEDMAPAAQGDQIEGCDEVLARAAVLKLVGLHGPSWNNPAILDLDWISYTAAPDRAASVMTRVYRPGVAPFIERCADKLEPEVVALAERAAQAEQLPSEYPIVSARCLTHNDYRLDNFLFNPRNLAASLRVVDWATYGAGNPMRDVSYFLGGCLLPELRARIEKDLVREYHDALCAAGVADYSWADCWDDYGKAAYHGLTMAMAAMVHVKQTERGDRLFAIMAQRHARQILDLGADRFLS